MKKLLLFNHKGGVSKTTSAFNIGWMLALKGKKVLLVDADPQCNLTGMILNESFEEYYWEENTKNHNIMAGVSVAFEGKPHIIEAVDAVQSSDNSNLFLLPGHPNLTEYDPALSFAQNSNNAITTLQNLPGAFNELIDRTCAKYNIDISIIDLNPGLSAINQNLFISSDAFIIPTSPDPFSKMALNTLSKVLPRWVDWANRMRPIFSAASYQLSETNPKFIGEIIQRFNVRKGKAAKPYRDNMDEIKNIINSTLIPRFANSDMLFEEEKYKQIYLDSDYCIAEIPDFQGLLPKAHEAGVPVYALTSSQIKETGPVLEQLEKNRDKFYSLFSEIADKIITISG
ncbi:MAG: AAA family ATPase [Bacteroidota bacterium]